MNNEFEAKDFTVLGQKYAFATASLVLGVACFVNLLGLEKAILAIAFGWLALRAQPAPVLQQHRAWAKAGVILGVLPLIIVPLVLILNYERLRELIANPSDSRTVGTTRSVIGRFKSIIMRRMIATCCASFWPKNATSG